LLNMVQITINGEQRGISESSSVADLLTHLGYDPRRVAVEVNREVVPLADHDRRCLASGDAVEIVRLVGGGAPQPPLPSDSHDVLRIGKFRLQNRLITGTGKYASFELMRECLAASGCEVTTVAVRRERLLDPEGRSILDYLDLDRYTVLPNTAGCFSAED